jgi:hypothetical protein
MVWVLRSEWSLAGYRNSKPKTLNSKPKMQNLHDPTVTSVRAIPFRRNQSAFEIQTLSIRQGGPLTTANENFGGILHPGNRMNAKKKNFPKLIFNFVPSDVQNRSDCHEVYSHGIETDCKLAAQLAAKTRVHRNRAQSSAKRKSATSKQLR